MTREISNLQDLYEAINAADAHLVDAHEHEFRSVADTGEAQENAGQDIAQAREILRGCSFFLRLRKDVDLTDLMKEIEVTLCNPVLEVRQMRTGKWRIELWGEDAAGNVWETSQERPVKTAALNDAMRELKEYASK